MVWISKAIPASPQWIRFMWIKTKNTRAFWRANMWPPPSLSLRSGNNRLLNVLHFWDWYKNLAAFLFTRKAIALWTFWALIVRFFILLLWRETDYHMSDIEMEPFVPDERSGLVFCFFTPQPLLSSFFVCETNERPRHSRCWSASNRKNEIEWPLREVLCLKEKKLFECSRKPFDCVSRAQITHVVHGPRTPSYRSLCSLFDSMCFVLVSPNCLVGILRTLSSLDTLIRFAIVRN